MVQLDTVNIIEEEIIKIVKAWDELTGSQQLGMLRELVRLAREEQMTDRDTVPCWKDGCKGFLLKVPVNTPIYKNETYYIANTHIGERQVIKEYHTSYKWQCSLCERIL